VRAVQRNFDILRANERSQGLQKGIERRAPFGLTPSQTDGVEPSVMPLNMLGVSLAVIHTGGAQGDKQNPE
jgi:hypothetical protein